MSACPACRAVSLVMCETWISTDHGESYKAGEYIRGLAKLEAEERDRCANFATKAIATGLNERMVRVAEQQGTMLAGIVMAALAEAGASPEVAAAIKSSVARQVRELGAGS